MSGAPAIVLSTAARKAWSSAPETSIIPLRRSDDLFRRSVPPLAEAVAGLPGRVACAVADAQTGEMLEVLDALVPMPPASVAKAMTTAYGLDRLGPGFRFRTALVTDGTLADGRLEGDLWLVGGGDPVLDTDALDAMARALGEIGLREVTGAFRVATGALPFIDQIDPSQLPHAGYNPSVSALNLNFNRVFFEWERAEGDYRVRMDARGTGVSPSVTVSRMTIEDRDYPVYTFERGAARDEWTVARGALGDNGGRWLPVRRPSAYAAEVFQMVARERGIALGAPVMSDAAPEGAGVLVEHVSEALEDILRSMMRWSTNLTAEIVGLMATQAGGVRPATLQESGAEMSAWMHDRLGARNVTFIDHSGLGADSRIRPNDMTRALVTAGPNGMLRGLMKDIPMLDGNGVPVPNHPLDVVAKTGTLNFVSTLAGYVEPPSGRVLAFSIFCADLERRASLTRDQMERPPGGRSYLGRARRLQQGLVERWAAMFG
ncbi:D-alanyl-D-alanine carboxypeptidase/D-alanyl-D-alanine-endopeptidase [Roseibacterium sp. SDUM158017]|uniref:D-alanyl-D-alanine carboxypeptidase/D-alanyl-D-alanine endopeptidase n=1 Tax=Roseicyclus salinarum TaxID=3036773 RepID=UPI002414E303|nr:D-alanyl-D-alanine carboxypeptidase/D-alanyl-D-alanine-endopeptidase [Roseibacterium sp. SDUM158017]MDG4647960.1 D-alanyl-D-alanine carboxypeptidase/D-alanyl-D-alanine-endopeptidase [Roseibacterium sp. SDUM158017]